MYARLFTLYLVGMFLMLGKTIAQPQSKNNLAQVASSYPIETNAVRLVYHAVDSTFYYATVYGEIYMLKFLPDGQLTSHLFSNAAAHGITFLQGMDMQGDRLVICGNVDAFQPLTIGRVSICENVRNGDNWQTVAVTEPYQSADYFDHLFSSIVFSPNGSHVIVCSGARGSHGEVQDYYGQYPGVRNLPITAVLLEIPIRASTQTLLNDSSWLQQNGYYYAFGIRNTFAMAYGQNGQLFGVENSGDRDDPEEFNVLEKGAHYGFPWTMGGNLNPQQFVPFNPAADLLINPFSRAMRLGFFSEDPTFPKPPSHISFKEPIKNLGPDINFYRNQNNGKIEIADSNNPIYSFTPHMSPTGLFIDKDNQLERPFTGNMFMVSWTKGVDSAGVNWNDTSLGPFLQEGQDLTMLSWANDSSGIYAQTLISNFNRPIAVCAGHEPNYLYVLENSSQQAFLHKVALGSAVGGRYSVEKEKSVHVYATDKVIHLQNRDAQSLLVEVYNLLGKIEATFVTKETIDKVELNQLAGGVYVVKVIDRNSSKTWSKKVVLH